MLVRTWNVFHGNASPPERRGFLEAMVRLATADEPDVLCLQELPVWSLVRLADWSGMIPVAEVAARPLLRPLPWAAGLGRVLTDVNHGLLRSAFTGQANAVLVASSLGVLGRSSIVLNPRRIRRRTAHELHLRRTVRMKWATERRVCQAVRLGASGGSIVVGNLHATGSVDRRITQAEVVRAIRFAADVAAPGEPLVLAGDFNLADEWLATLATGSGLSGATPHGIDHVLTHGVDAGDPVRWPDERRRLDERLLSDHAPVEREIA